MTINPNTHTLSTILWSWISSFSLFTSPSFSLIGFQLHSISLPIFMASSASRLTTPSFPISPSLRNPPKPSPPFLCQLYSNNFSHSSSLLKSCKSARKAKKTVCKATEVSVAEETPASGDGKNWVPVVPLAALPRGERRVIIQDGETILLLWYKDLVMAIENKSPAEGAYSEGLLNAKLTPDGCIVCPSTDSTYDLRSGAVKEWYPKNPVLRFLTPSLRPLYVYPVKYDDENIYISMGAALPSGGTAEIVFSGRAQPGVTASDVNVDEVRMIIDESEEGFGFTRRTELINGKAAIIGFLLLLDFELLTGKGILKGTGFLDFIYAASNAFN